MQKGDVKKTHASTEKLYNWISINQIRIQTGIKQFLDWYKFYYNITI